MSGVGFVVDEEALPVPDVVAEVAGLSDSDLTAMLLGDSVDFQLIFTVPPGDIAPLKRAFQEQDLCFFEIGVATQGRDVVLRHGDGAAEDLPGDTWRHAT